MGRLAVDDRRTALLGAAMRVIARDGVTQATTRAVAAEAGMPTASVHYAFESRAAMFAELARTLVESQHVRLTASMEHAASLESALDALPAAYVDYLRSDPEAEQALIELVNWSRTVDGLHELPRAVYDVYQESAEAVLALIEARFELEWNRPRAELGRWIVAVADGVTARWLVDRDDDGARRVMTGLAHAIMLAARQQ